MNQSQLTLEHLRTHGSITAKEAKLPPINCERLASRIDDIHNGRGVEMAQTRRVMIEIPSGKRVAKYYLIKDNPKIAEYTEIRNGYPENSPHRDKIDIQIAKLKG